MISLVACLIALPLLISAADPSSEEPSAIDGELWATVAVYRAS